MYNLWRQGYDIHGIDAVEENIRLVGELHPEIADRVSIADLRSPLDFPEEHFDFILCSAVIQHMNPQHVFGVTLPEFARVLKADGVLQLMFKNGVDVLTVFDRDFGVERSFQLYDEHEVIGALKSLGLELVEPEDSDQLGGIMYFTDPKPTGHCVFYVRKQADA